MTMRIPWRTLLLSGFSYACVLAPLTASDAYIAWEHADRNLDLGSGDGVVGVAYGSPDSAWAVVDHGGLWHSTDGGITWAKVAGDCPALATAAAVAASPNDGVTALISPTGAPGLWRTTDGGKTWTACVDLATVQVATITFSADGGLVFAGARDGKTASVSHDAGQTWTPVDLGADIKGQQILPIDDKRWVAIGQDAAAVRFTADAGTTWTAATGNGLDYFPGRLAVVACGDALFSSKHHGFNVSKDAGATWNYVMEVHTRVIGTLGDTIFREGDRTPIRGTHDRILNLETSNDLGQSWHSANSGILSLLSDDQRKDLIITTDVDPYAHQRFATAWAAAPGNGRALLALGKAGVYRCTPCTTKGGPVIGDAVLEPLSVIAGDDHTPVVIHVAAAAKHAALKRVTARLGDLAPEWLDLYDDGAHHDGDAGDHVFGNTFTVPKTAAPGRYTIGVVAEDMQGHMSSSTATLEIGSTDDRIMIWDGDQFGRGQAWVAPQNNLNYIKAQTDEAHNGRVALEFYGTGAGWIGGGWNWHGWYPENSGDDIRRYRNLSVWVKIVADGDIGSINFNLKSNNKAVLGDNLDIRDYCPNILDGAWHNVVIPLEDMAAASKDHNFDARGVWELGVGTWAPQARTFSIYIDEISFDNQAVRPRSVMVSLPEDRTAKPLDATAPAVAATVDLSSPGKPISPYIYGIAMGDAAVTTEIGATSRRAGGNPISPFDWRSGFTSSGADWFYANTGTASAPEKTWMATFHRESQNLGTATYLSIPLMGRVAKDGTSCAFDITKYPDQEMWAGKAQPTDAHPNAGNGRQAVKGADGKPTLDDQGKPVFKDITPDPDDSSAPRSVEDEAEFFHFLITKMGYGTADKGGIPFLALDNEPCLWCGTHRGMHPIGVSYDELWNITERATTLFKTWDPAVKVAGPALWGWTAYFNSGLDAQNIQQGKGSWDAPADRAAHGGDPFALWYLKQVAAHKKKTGVQLVDLLDFHFYPQDGIYLGGVRNDPQWMEKRVQETRVLWDPDFVDETWMGRQKSDQSFMATDKPGVIALIPLMKKWITMAGLGGQMGISLGEYNFGGEEDASGGVAECELMGIFAREGVDHAYYWLCPAKNSSTFFAWKMYRNPDGKHTAWGDVDLPTTVDHQDDVSVHAARDSASGRVSLILVNKRALKSARVTVKLSKTVAAQSATVWEYGISDTTCIGALPALPITGDTITIDLPAMTVRRLDFKP
jgi:photosystem II stability/assembly factor-like uncharacterized protein